MQFACRGKGIPGRPPDGRTRKAVGRPGDVAQHCGRLQFEAGHADRVGAMLAPRPPSIIALPARPPTPISPTSSPVPPPPPPNPDVTGDGIVVHVFGKTDVGRTREHNEDAFVVADLTTNNSTLQPEVPHALVRPEGLAVHGRRRHGRRRGRRDRQRHGRRRRARRSCARAGSPIAGERPGSVRPRDQAATKSANEQIHGYASTHPEYRGMGTTATIAGLLGDTLYLAQVGDSRAYLVRDGIARQITKDQSLMQKLIEAGELTEEEAEHSERRNIILQALGPEPAVKVDLTHQTVRRGDVLVLCSDGLSGQVPKDDIGDVVSEEPTSTRPARS